MALGLLWRELSWFILAISQARFSVGLASIWITESASRFSHFWTSIVSPLLSTAPLLSVLISSALVVGEDNEIAGSMETAMGALAGSTIYVLTLLWVLALWRGRCDFDESGAAINSVAGRLTWASLTQSGVTLDRNALIAGRVMCATMLSYFIIQGPAFQYVQQPVSSLARVGERNYALAAAIVCAILLAAYFLYSFFFLAMSELRMSLAKELGEERLLGRRIKFVRTSIDYFQSNLARWS